MSRLAKLIRVKEFDLYQDQESLRSKPEPPWKWFKLPTSLLQDPILRELTNAQFGAYVKLIAMAAETGNRILLDGRWLRDRAQIRLNVVRTLIQLGFLVEFELDIESNEYKELRLIYSGRSSWQRERKGEEAITKKEPSEDDQAIETPKQNTSIEPSQILTNGANDSDKPTRIDPRPFKEIKRLVLMLAKLLNTNEASKIHKCAPSYNMTERQISKALGQLQQDGEL